MLLHVFQGFCIALADSVPGVSGGTVAFILGFYEPFLSAVHSLFGKDSTARKAAFLYLLKLGVGWSAGLIGSVLLLARLFENHIYFLSSLFFGLTLVSIPCIVKAERRQILGRLQNCPFALLGLALVCGLTWFRAGSPGGALDYTALGPLQYGCLFLSGALAVSAMVLPGISGSSLLLIMEVYLPTVNAAHALLHLDFSVLPGVLVLGLGILAGAALSVRALRAALRKQRSRMLWLILGLMLGLIYRLVITNIDGFGDVGNGYYSAGFQIYTLLLALSSVGIPSAISKLVAQAEAAGNHRRSEDIFHTAMALFFGVGLVCAAALYLGADFIARSVIGMDGVQGTLRALFPAVLFVCLSSVFRGYYLGLGSAKAAGSSQVVEQLLKSVLTVAIALALTGYSAQAMSAGANLATSIAAGGGAAYLALYHIRAKRKAGRPTVYRKLSKRSLFALSKTILRLSVPVSAASIIASAGSVIDTGTVSRGIAAAFAGGIPGQAGIPSTQELSQEAVRLMGVLSKGDSILNLPLALNQTVTGGLQGIGEVDAPAKALLCGAAVKAALNLLLIPIPAVNIYGAPIASAACYLTAFLFGFHRLKSTVRLSRSCLSYVLRTAFCAAVMGVGARLAYQALDSLLRSNALALLTTIAGSAVFYFAPLLTVHQRFEFRKAKN